jgi:tetratricopeptide (TPR) repeat protein
MTRVFTAPLLARLLVPLVLIPLLGITTRPHRVDQALRGAQRDLSEALPLNASLKIAAAGERFPWRADLWELAGHYALQGDDPGAAQAYFQRAAQAGNLSPAGQTALGDAASQLGDLTGAIRAWESVLQAGGPSVDPYTRLAEAHSQLGDYPAAIAALQALTALEPADPQVHYRLGLLMAASQPESALAYLERAAELDPAFAEPAQAIQRSVRTARLSGDPAHALVAAGQALASLEEWKLAAEAFRLAAQARPDYAEAWAFLGEAHQHLGEDGLPELQKALRLAPDSVAGNTFLGLYWRRQARSDLALVYLHAAANLDPQNPALQSELGNTLASLGDLPAARDYYQRAVELVPQDPAYWRTLAAFSVHYEFEVRAIALPAVRQAVLLNPKDPASLDVMGQVFTLLNDPFSARRFLQRALQVDPGYVPARLHLGLLFLLEGDPARAQEQLNLVLSLSPPDSADAEQAHRLLNSYFP